MSIKYEIKWPIQDIFSKWDFLGFEGTWQCGEAILTHEDWSTRWDLSDATLDDLETVGKWREQTLENNKLVKQ